MSSPTQELLRLEKICKDCACRGNIERCFTAKCTIIDSIELLNSIPEEKGRFYKADKNDVQILNIHNEQCVLNGHEYRCGDYEDGKIHLRGKYVEFTLSVEVISPNTYRVTGKSKSEKINHKKDDTINHNEILHPDYKRIVLS